MIVQKHRTVKRLQGGGAALKESGLERVQFGSGKNRLSGWLNCDLDVDIRRPLPFADGAVSFAFAEHVIEHVQHLQAVAFLGEVLRILKPGGVLRIAFPDVTRITERNCAPMLQKAELRRDRGAPDVWLAIMTQWGHQACWTRESMRCALLAVGFESVKPCGYGKSNHDELRGVDGHHLAVGLEVAALQTTILEACKAA
jgi:SAM-dependent methyltransferase